MSSLLPIELISLIIIKAGNIPLLRKISNHYRKEYHHLITFYDTITAPIQPHEIEEYLKSFPKSIWVFYKNSHSPLAYRYSMYNTSYYSNDFYFKDFFVESGIDMQSLIPCSKMETDLVHITHCNNNNYDLTTIYHIILQRYQNHTLARKVCLDTLNHYLNTFSYGDIQVYLYMCINQYVQIPYVYAKNYNIVIQKLFHHINLLSPSTLIPLSEHESAMMFVLPLIMT